ncbi:MAG: chloride channel protein [Deltaproteobacteria bacterium]|nr:chloride channel protein [Deltaproteobacteria bacterium]
MPSAPAPNRFFLWRRALSLSLLIGLLSGLSASLFLVALAAVTDLREAHLWLVWLLPVGGLLLGAAYERWGATAGQGTNRIIDALADGGNPLPGRLAPMVLLGTLLTHLVGGSAGREGTAVQMGAGLADGLSRREAASPELRRLMLFAGVGGGFGAVFGTPFAGALFAAEFVVRRRLCWEALPVALVAALAGDATVHWLGVSHFPFPRIEASPVTPQALAAWALLGAGMGLLARSFVWLSHGIKAASERHLPRLPMRLAAGGALLLLLTLAVGSRDYLGLGLPLLTEAFGAGASGPEAFALKLLFTAVTVGVGFIGGEVTPLFVIGALAGRAAATMLGLPPIAGAAVGMVALFGAAANTPVALLVMAVELFGISVLPQAALALVAATLVSGQKGIYGTQRIALPSGPHTC